MHKIQDDMQQMQEPTIHAYLIIHRNMPPTVIAISLFIIWSRIIWEGCNGRNGMRARFHGIDRIRVRRQYLAGIRALHTRSQSATTDLRMNITES